MVSRAAFLLFLLAVQDRQVLTLSGKERTRGKVNLKQLSGQSGHVVDGLWASSPVWVGLFIKTENKQNNVSMENFNIDILKQHSRLNKTINTYCLTLK